MNEKYFIKKIHETSTFLEKEYGIELGNAQVYFEDEDIWNGHVELNRQRGLDLVQDFFFAPKNNSAHIRIHSDCHPSTLHAVAANKVFYQDTIIGKELNRLINSSKNNSFNCDRIEIENTRLPFNGYIQPNLQGFTNWLGGKISEKTKNSDSFKKIVGRYDQSTRELIKSMYALEEKFTDKGLLWVMGVRARQDKDSLAKIINTASYEGNESIDISMLIEEDHKNKKYSLLNIVQGETRVEEYHNITIASINRDEYRKNMKENMYKTGISPDTVHNVKYLKGSHKDMATLLKE